MLPRGSAKTSRAGFARRPGRYRNDPRTFDCHVIFLVFAPSQRATAEEVSEVCRSAEAVVFPRQSREVRPQHNRRESKRSSDCGPANISNLHKYINSCPQSLSYPHSLRSVSSSQLCVPTSENSNGSCRSYLFFVLRTEPNPDGQRHSIEPASGRRKPVGKGSSIARLSSFSTDSRK